MKKNYERQTLNRKKLIVLIVIVVLAILFLIAGIVYEKNTSVRNFLDKYVFFKEKYENDLPKIAITSSSDINTYAYKGDVLILKNNLLTAYNSNGNKEYELDIEISEPIFETAGEYLCIGEKNGNKLYMISNKNINWQKKMEGTIEDITLNSNGYVSVATTGTIYKAVIETFDNTGELLFTDFLSSTYVIDMSLSPDNKKLAIAEANFSGIMIQSNIKEISIEKAKNGDTESIEYKQTNTNGDLIVNIKYLNKNELACIYDNHIEVIKDGTSTNISDFSKEETLFADLNNKIIKIIKQDSKIYLKVITNEEHTKEYEISEPKEIVVSDEVTAINLGSEVLFYNNSGWLIKRYYASQEINKIVLSDSLAGIVYNDKIELVSL